MSDPVDILKGLVNRQKTIIKAQKETSKKIEAEKIVNPLTQKDQPNQKDEPSPNVSGASGV